VPSWGRECHSRADWPVKVPRGTFSETKKMALEHRYALRHVRVVFQKDQA
jgi:hypothetical protein